MKKATATKNEFHLFENGYYRDDHYGSATPEAAQLIELSSIGSGFQIEEIPMLTIEAAIPGENFDVISQTSYQDPDFVGCFNDLMGCNSVMEKAIRVSDYLALSDGYYEYIGRATFEALRRLDLETAREFFAVLENIAPGNNLAEHMCETLPEVAIAV